METIVKAEKLIKYYGTKENPVKAVDQIDLGQIPETSILGNRIFLS